MIYSFRRNSIEETLKDHVKEMLRILEDSTDSKVFKFAEKLSVSKKVFHDSIKIAVIFHDSGKIFYQKPSGNLSFPGHERASTYILDIFTKKLIRINMLENKVRNLMLFSVLYHHHAMGERNYHIESSVKLKHLFEEFTRDVSELMEQYDLKSYINPLKEVITLFVEKMGCKPEATQIKEVENELWDHYVNSEVKTLMLLSLSILVSLDYEAAKKLRGGAYSPFYPAVKEFTQNYLQNNLKF